LHAHRFFEDEKERREWQNSEAILVDIGVKAGLTFVDVGCGRGFLAFPAARLIGKRARVYGLDVDSEAIRRLKEKSCERKTE
jgi:ubiquinone/menaquinone biosynthesis C-methylase UbiE